jgi:hypothetical protein
VVVMVVMSGSVAVGVENCAHGFLLIPLPASYLPRCASTSAGCTTWPVLLDQEFFV